jgi:hypothetical protein
MGLAWQCWDGAMLVGEGGIRDGVYLVPNLLGDMKYGSDNIPND